MTDSCHVSSHKTYAISFPPSQNRKEVLNAKRICLKHGTVAEREQVFNFCVLCLADSMLIAEGRQGVRPPGGTAQCELAAHVTSSASGNFTQSSQLATSILSESEESKLCN